MTTKEAFWNSAKNDPSIMNNEELVYSAMSKYAEFRLKEQATHWGKLKSACRDLIKEIDGEGNFKTSGENIINIRYLLGELNVIQ